MNESIASLLRFWQAGGILMPILAAVSFGIWYLSFRLYIPLLYASRRMKKLSLVRNTTRGIETATPPTRVANVMRDGESPPGMTYDIYPAADSNGYEIDQMRPYEWYLNVLRALVACSPLLGLLGTVKGMITTFIALGSRGIVSMDMLSMGISEALITTQVGLIVAIPGLVSAHASARLIARMKGTLDRLGLGQPTIRNKKARS